MKKEAGAKMGAVLVVVGIVLSLGPLLGTVWSVLTMLLGYSADLDPPTGESVSVMEANLPWRPIAVGFAVFPLGLALLAVSVRRYSRRLRSGREQT